MTLQSNPCPFNFRPPSLIHAVNCSLTTMMKIQNFPEISSFAACARFRVLLIKIFPFHLLNPFKNGSNWRDYILLPADSFFGCYTNTVLNYDFDIFNFVVFQLFTLCYFYTLLYVICAHTFSLTFKIRLKRYVTVRPYLYRTIETSRIRSTFRYVYNCKQLANRH